MATRRTNRIARHLQNDCGRSNRIALRRQHLRSDVDSDEYDSEEDMKDLQQILEHEKKKLQIEYAQLKAEVLSLRAEKKRFEKTE